MSSRNILIITILLLCQLVVATSLVATQLPLPAPSPQGALSAAIPDEDAIYTYPSQGGEDVHIAADVQEKYKAISHLRGRAEIRFRTYVLQADEMTYDEDTGDATATGHVVITGGPADEHIVASHGVYNVRTETGKLYDVVGTLGVLYRGKRVILKNSEPFSFRGTVLEKKGPTRYILSHGAITSCKLPRPKWTFNANQINFEAGEEAKIYNSTLRIEGIPVIFLPFTEHPVQKLGRQTGFLTPRVGNSTVKGAILGDGLFWAINRSTDLTLGAEYWASLGIAQHAYLRMLPSQTSYLNLIYYGVLDQRTDCSQLENGKPKCSTPSHQGGEDIKLDGAGTLPFGFRGVAAVNYLSSYIFRLAFAENFAEAVNSEVKSAIFATSTRNGFSISGTASRYQDFQSTTPGELVTILHAPSVELSSVDRSLGPTPFYWAVDFALEGLSRKQPGFVTKDLVGRGDLHPRLSFPGFFHGWTLRGEAGVRDTYYTQRLDTPSGQDPASSNATLSPGLPGRGAINRRALELSYELRPPTLGKIFDRPIWGRTLKHTVEPVIEYQYVNGISNFNRIIRFDSRDIASDTNQVQFGLTNRLFAKKASLNCVPGEANQPSSCPVSRELVTWEVLAVYYFDPTFGGAIVSGRRNAITASTELTGIAFLTEPRQWSPVVSRLRFHTSENTSAQWKLDYDPKKGRISSSDATFAYQLHGFSLSAGNTLLQSPGENIINTPLIVATQLLSPDKFNQYHVSAGYGSSSKRGFSVIAALAIDAHAKKQDGTYGSAFQSTMSQASYNWDCCGLDVEYRRLGLNPIKHANEYFFSFKLANIGSFGSLRRQDRIF